MCKGDVATPRVLGKKVHCSENPPSTLKGLLSKASGFFKGFVLGDERSYAVTPAGGEKISGGFHEPSTHSFSAETPPLPKALLTW